MARPQKGKSEAQGADTSGQEAQPDRHGDGAGGADAGAVSGGASVPKMPDVQGPARPAASTAAAAAAMQGLGQDLLGHPCLQTLRMLLHDFHNHELRRVPGLVPSLINLCQPAGTTEATLYQRLDLDVRHAIQYAHYASDAHATAAQLEQLSSVTCTVAPCLASAHPLAPHPPRPTERSEAYFGAT